MPFLGCYGTVEGIMLLGLYYLGIWWWVALGSVLERLGGWYTSYLIFFVCYGMNRVW